MPSIRLNTVIRTLSLLCLSACASVALAGEIKPYSPPLFDKLTSEGKPVVVHVSAPWCPTCRAQKPILQSLMQNPQYKAVTLLDVDFDSDQAALARFKVNKQSTLIAFKKGAEAARSVGDTTPSGLETLVQKALP